MFTLITLLTLDGTIAFTMTKFEDKDDAGRADVAVQTMAKLMRDEGHQCEAKTVVVDG